MDIKKPEWLRIKYRQNSEIEQVVSLLNRLALHTVCQEAKCPNLLECFAKKTATFMILGDVCTRSCKFCATATGHPLTPEQSEPQRVADSISLMGLRHAVITSVDRDDLPDGGANHWRRTIEAVRATNPNTTIEVLVPDFEGREESIEIVLAASPDIVGHNIETVERLTPLVRSKAQYRRSLTVLRAMADRGALTKSGLMLGLGESEEEVLQTLSDLREAGVEIVTLGQYLRPTAKHYPVKEYVTPEKFEWYRKRAEQMGFRYVASAPLVRSSYLADRALECCRDSKTAE